MKEEKKFYNNLLSLTLTIWKEVHKFIAQPDVATLQDCKMKTHVLLAVKQVVHWHQEMHCSD